MMPNQSIFGGKMHIIRPSFLPPGGPGEKIRRGKGIAVYKNPCPSSDVSKRIYVKNLLNTMEKDNRKVRDNLFRAMRHVKPDYLPTKYVKTAR